MRIQAANISLLLFLTVLAIGPWAFGEGGMAFLFEVFLMLAMAQLWNLLAGQAGLVSMGLQCFVGLGGYTAIFLSNALEVPAYWVLLAAPVVCGLVAAATAAFLLRLRDIYFSISTWVLSEIVAMLVFIAPGLGHATGMTLVTARMVDFETFQRVNFWLAGLLVAGSFAGCYLMLRSPIGLGIMSARDNELAASSIGVNVWFNRFVAYVASAAVCGLAGALSFTAAMFVTATTAFDVNWVVAMIFIVIVGGIGTLEGPIFGTIIYFGLRELFTVALTMSGSWYLIAMGTVAVLTILFAPKGLWPAIRERFGLDWLSVQRKMPQPQSCGKLEG